MHRVVVKYGLALVAAVSVATAVATTSSAASTNHASGGSRAPGVAAAKAAIAPYLTTPSPFPVTQPLKKSVKGKTVDYMSSGTPFDELLYQLTVPAAKVLGLKLTQINTGTSASTISAAFDTAVADKPSAVIVPGSDPALWTPQLKKLQAMKVPIVASAILDGAKYKIPSVEGSYGDDNRSGRLMADYAVAKLDSSSTAKFAVYTVPEVPAITAVGTAFVAQLKKICPKCQARTVPISAQTLGSTAPNTVVSDLQAHTGTGVAVFADDEIELGLPAALKSGGITVKTLGYAPSPTNLQYLKEGQETAVLADDAAVSAWVEVDEAAREIDHQPLTGPELYGYDVVQFLTKKQLTFNIAKGWSGYPTFAQKFEKLWSAAK